MNRVGAARALQEIGERLRLQRANRFRAAAFARGAETLFALRDDLDALVAEGRLQELPAIGPGLARVIEELARSGRSSLLESLRAAMPPGALELSRLRWLRLPRIGALHQALGVESLDALEAACLAGRVREVKGFGPATEARLLHEIRSWREREGHLLLHRALPLAEAVVAHLCASPGIERADYAGALRRRHETITELDVVVSGASAARALDALGRFPRTDELVDRAESAGSARLTSGLPVRLSFARPEAYGTALVRATGSSAHWRRLEALADGANVEASDEAGHYRRLGLPWIPPELREDDGEIEAALAGELPEDLVRPQDVQGMVHCHTRHSDGRASVLAMARGAEALGMSYITITDHSPSASYARGVTLDRLQRQWDEIDRAQRKTSLRILRGTECDILADGALDYAIEVNGDPERLDLDPFWVRRARSRGLRFVISVDAHSVAQLGNLRYGVDIARRGWLRRGDVLNALPAGSFADAVRPA